MRMSVEERLSARLLGDREVQELLDDLPLRSVEGTLGTPETAIAHHEPAGRWWHQGDPRPVLADDDPAVMQAIGRCAASRARGVLVMGAIHPEGCQWCEYPTGLVLAACEWASWSSRYVTSVIHRWRGKDAEYVRSGEAHWYANPRWQSFWALGVPEREARIRRATLGQAAA